MNDQKFIDKRIEMMEYFQENYRRLDQTERIVSPSGSFNLEICYFYHTENARRRNYTKGVITDRHGHIVDVIYRNFSSFVHKWIQIDKQEYLLCGLDYQGYTIVDVIQQKTHHYVPEAAYNGMGFCWAAIFYFPDQKLLVVEGCYWAHPYELIFYDFSSPMNLPYGERFRIEIDSMRNESTWQTDRYVKYVDDEGQDKVFIF